MNVNKKFQTMLQQQRKLEGYINQTERFKKMTQSPIEIKQMQSISELFNKANITIEEFEKLLSELNYPPIPNMSGHHMNILIKEIKKLENDEEAIKLLDEYIVLRFDYNKLDQRLRIWNNFDWLDDRLKILEQIVEAHKHELYFLSVLAVFPQIEGILAELFPEKRQIKKGKKEFTTFHLKESIQEILEVESDLYDKQWDKFYKNNLLEGFEHTEPIEHLSRHALAHGADYKYGDRVNSTKSIIILDYLLTKINNYLQTKD